MKFEWETIHEKLINSQRFTYTERARVFGGWLVNSRAHHDGVGHESMVFMPDPQHKWTLDPTNEYF